MNKKLKNDNWLSLYIFIKPPMEKMLTECLLPITEKYKAKSKIEKFFFIRYSEGGSHIRFRLHFKKQSYIVESQNEITKQINDYITTNDIISSSLSGLYITEKKYEPEYDRYGGDRGIIIAENIFHYSSLTILNIIKQVHWNYNKAILFAIILNYIMLYVIIKDINSILDILKFNYYRWILKGQVQETRQQSIDELHQKRTSLFKIIFENTKHQILPIIRDYEMQLKIKRMRDENINNWMLINIKQELEINKIIIDINNSSLDNKKKLYKSYNIYDSYIHMNNNRLGIKNQDESLVAYLLYCSIKEIRFNEK